MPKPELLFDSTALVDLYRGQTVLRPHLDALITNDEVGYISVITEAELWRGLRADEVERHEALLALFTRLPLGCGSLARSLAGSPASMHGLYTPLASLVQQPASGYQRPL